MKAKCSVASFLFVVLVIFSITASAQINLNNGLVGYFTLDGNAIDSSPNAINGTVTNASLTLGKTNNIDSAYFFNGTTANISYSTHNRGITDAVTVSVWIKTTMLNIGWVVGKYDWQVDKGFAIQIKDGHPFVNGRNQSGAYISTYHANSNIVVNDGNWHHLLVVINGNSWSMYTDCLLDTTVISNAATPALNNPEPLAIGYYPFGGGTFNHNYFEGSIDEVRIYNRVLNSAELSLICDINYIDPVLSAPIVTNDTTVCDTTVLSLFATSDTGTIYWESPLGTIIDSGNNHVATITQNVDFYVYSVLNGVASSNSVISVTALHVDTALTQNGFTLTATQNGVAYQWVDCENWTIIPAATSQSFTPAITGYYALAVTNGDCSDTSRCFYVGAVGIEEIANTNNLKVYPNPVVDELTIESLTIYPILSVELVDASGKSITMFKELSTQKMAIDLSGYAMGIYFVRVQMQNEISIIKVVKAK